MFRKKVKPGSNRDTRQILSAKFQNLTRTMYSQSENAPGHQNSAVHAGIRRTQSGQWQHDHDVVFVRNDTYFDLRKFDVITLGPTVNDSRNSYADESQLYTESGPYQGLPQAPYRTGQTAVLLESVSRCSYALAVVTGGVWTNGAIRPGSFASTGFHDAANTPVGESEVTLAANLFGETQFRTYSEDYGYLIAEHARECYVIDSVNEGAPDPEVLCPGECSYKCVNSKWTIASESCSGDCRCPVGPGTDYDTCTGSEAEIKKQCASWPARRSFVRIGQTQTSSNQSGFAADRDRDIFGLCRYVCSSGSWTLEFDGSKLDDYTCLDPADIPTSIFPCDTSITGCQGVLKLPPIIDITNTDVFRTTSTSTTAAPTSTTTKAPSCLNSLCVIGMDRPAPYLTYSGCHSWYGPDRRCYCEFPAFQADGTWSVVGSRMNIPGGEAYVSQCKEASCTGSCYWQPTARGWQRINDSPCSPWCECPEPDEPAELYSDTYSVAGHERVSYRGPFVTSCGSQSCKPCSSGYCKWVSDPLDGSWSLESNTCGASCSCNLNPPQVSYQIDKSGTANPRSAVFYRKCCSNTLSSTTTVMPSTTAAPALSYSGCGGNCTYTCGPGGWNLTYAGCFPNTSCICQPPTGSCSELAYTSTENVPCGTTTTTTSTTPPPTTTTTVPPTTTTTTTTTSTQPPTTTTQAPTSTTSTMPPLPSTTTTTSSSSTTPLPP